MSNFGFPAASAGSSGFSFSAPQSTTTASAFTFGTGTPTVAAATPAPSFSFGTPTPAPAPAQSFPFGTPTPAATTLGSTGIGIGSAAPLNFGTTTSSAAAVPTLNFGGGQTPSLGLITTPMPASAPTAAATVLPTLGAPNAAGTGFNFGLSTTTSTSQQQPPSSGFSFGSNSATAGTSFLTAKTTGISLTPSTVTTCIAPGATTTTQSVGLGGIGLTASQQKQKEQKTDTIAVKDNLVPQEILKTVEDLKSFIKQQKAISSEISRTSIRKLSSVTNEVDSLKVELKEVSDSVQSTFNKTKALRNNTSKAIQNLEMVRQTADTPPSLQFENTAPLKYFQELVQKQEHDLILLRNQIELTEKQMRSFMGPQSLTPEELKKGMQQIHQCFVSLAGHLHTTHRKVETAKEQYMKVRGKFTNDTSDPFADIEDDGKEPELSKISSGPSPFSTVTHMNLNKFTGPGLQGSSRGTGSGTGITTIGGLQSTIPTVGIGPFGFSGPKPPPFGSTEQTIGSGIGSTAFSGFGSTNLSTIGGISTAPNFGEGLNLQKPPLGVKRNKQ